MVEIQSKEVIDKISDELKIQPALEIPKELAKLIQLTYVINPKRIIDVFGSGRSTTTGTSTILITSPERDTFITGISWSLHADVTNNGVAANVNITLADGRVVEVINLQKLAALEQLFEKFLMFDPPIKLLRGSSVTHNHTFTLGSSAMNTVIFGYQTDPQ